VLTLMLMWYFLPSATGLLDGMEFAECNARAWRTVKMAGFSQKFRSFP